MWIPVLCVTCGCPIGDKGSLFRHLRARRVKAALEARGTTATQAAIDSGLKIECEDILDLLGVRYDCCRAHFVTAMVFSDFY